jgi:serine protease AprX
VSPEPDFGSRLVQVRLDGQTGSLDDAQGHGSLVAGVAAGASPDGRFVGVAPGATIYALNVNNPAGANSSDVISALQWVFENAHAYNIRVVNLSLQETVTSSYETSLLDLAVERLWAAGIVVVAAAGNTGAGTTSYAPANDPLALTVGSTDNRDTLSSLDDVMAAFSSSGVTGDGFAKPELLAPGRHIVSTLSTDSLLWQQAPAANRISSGSGYVSISGTSFSAPQVAGAAAVLFEEHPGWSPDNVKWLLGHTSQAVAGSSVRALSLGTAVAFNGTPGLANQGVPALVCAPSTECVVAGTVGTVSSSWNSSSWNSSSWNSSSWNSSSWNSSSWNSSSWNSSSWNSSSWNSSSWNSSSWNSSSWNSSSWNSASWN